MKALCIFSAYIPMTQLSIRDVTPATAAKLKRNATRKGQSLNRYLQSVLRQTAAGEQVAGRTAHDDLDALAGTWTAAQGQAFERATAPFAEVDPALWR